LATRTGCRALGVAQHARDFVLEQRNLGGAEHDAARDKPVSCEAGDLRRGEHRCLLRLWTVPHDMSSF
jgi:hypothetical protein